MLSNKLSTWIFVRGEAPQGPYFRRIMTDSRWGCVYHRGRFTGSLIGTRNAVCSKYTHRARLCRTRYEGRCRLERSWPILFFQIMFATCPSIMTGDNKGRKQWGGACGGLNRMHLQWDCPMRIGRAMLPHESLALIFATGTTPEHLCLSVTRKAMC